MSIKNAGGANDGGLSPDVQRSADDEETIISWTVAELRMKFEAAIPRPNKIQQEERKVKNSLIFFIPSLSITINLMLVICETKYY